MIKQSLKAIMNSKLFLLVLLISSISIISCSFNDAKTNTKPTKNEVAKIVKTESVSLAISGMTCEIGCAKTIQSKLSKKEGVTDAIVVFSDSTATVSFDSSKTSTTDISSFISGIAGGDAYTASELKPKKSL